MNLIIQGPLISKTSFRNSSRKNKDNNKAVTFICIDNIHEILKKYRHKFSYVIISTWETDKSIMNELELICKRYKVEIIYLNKPSFDYSFEWKINDTRHLQYFGTIKAIDHINKMKTNLNKVTLRIRTDQYIYLEPIIDQIISNKDKLKEKILFPYSLSGDLFSVSDFFVAAHHNLISKYYKYLYDNLKIPSGSKSIHVDQVQKYLNVIKNIENPSKSFCRIFTIVAGDCMQEKLIPIQEKHLKSWYKILNENFILTKNNWIQESNWRGNNMDFAKGKIYSEDLKSYKRFYKKMTKLWKREISSNNFLSNFIFNKLPIFRKKFKLLNPLFFISYYLRVLLLKL